MQNKAQYLRIFIIDSLLNFVLFVFPVVWVTMHLQTGHLEDREQAQIFFVIIVYYKLVFITAGLNIKGTKAVKMVET